MHPHMPKHTSKPVGPDQLSYASQLIPGGHRDLRRPNKASPDICRVPHQVKYGV